jgi:hypothetical protein
VNGPQHYRLRLTRVDFDDPFQEEYHIDYLLGIPGNVDREKAEEIIGWEAQHAWRTLQKFIRKVEVGEE